MLRMQVYEKRNLHHHHPHSHFLLLTLVFCFRLFCFRYFYILNVFRHNFPVQISKLITFRDQQRIEFAEQVYLPGNSLRAAVAIIRLQFGYIAHQGLD